jgi:hypothetical protein
MSSRTSRLLLAGLFVAAVALLLPAAARSQDPLKDAAARQQVELQRAQAEFKKANDAASKVSSDPKKAIAILLNFREALESNADLPDKERAEMVGKLNLRIGAFTGRLSDPASVTAPPPARLRDDKRAEDEAKKLVDDAKKYRQGPAYAKSQQAYIEEQRRQGYLSLQLDNDKLTIPPSGDIEFPRDWAEKTRKRSQMNVTERERKLLEALAKPITIDLKDSTLEAVLGYLSDKTGVNLIVPNVILEERSITYQTPVSVSLKDVTLRTVLKKVLSDVGLTYVINKEVIQITTEERAKQMFSTRTYYVGDLIGLTDYRLGGLNSRAQAMLAINDIIGMIVGSVEPQSWWVNGGPGTIAFDPRTMSLIIKQTAEIHYMLGIGKR